MIKLLC